MPCSSPFLQNVKGKGSFMLESLFGLFDSVLISFPNYDFFISLCAAGVLFFIGCLIKFIIFD